MAEKLYKVNEVIPLGYQAPGAKSGKDVKADIYKPDKSKTVASPVTLTELGTTGTYRNDTDFTPDLEGEWQVVMYIDKGGGQTDNQVTKSFSVGGHNVDSIGDKVDQVDTDVTSIRQEFESGGLVEDIHTKVDELDTPPMAF